MNAAIQKQGQRKTRFPGKATLAQKEERIKWLAQQMLKHPSLSRFQIHKLMKNRYGLNWATTDEIYVPHAKKLIIANSDISKEEAKAISVRALLKNIDDGIDVPASVRLLGDIFGFYAPKMTYTKTSGDESIAVEVGDIPRPTVEQARRWLMEDQKYLKQDNNGE